MERAFGPWATDSRDDGSGYREVYKSGRYLVAGCVFGRVVAPVSGSSS
jgi:hypothetical protein